MVSVLCFMYLPILVLQIHVLGCALHIVVHDKLADPGVPLQVSMDPRYRDPVLTIGKRKMIRTYKLDELSRAVTKNRYTNSYTLNIISKRN